MFVKATRIELGLYSIKLGGIRLSHSFHVPSTFLSVKNRVMRKADKTLLS